MSARLRAPIPSLAEGERVLDKETSRYLAGSLRLREGDAFVAFDPERAREADATIARLDRSRLVVRIGSLRPARVTAVREVAWVQGIAKGEKMDAIVRDATELGVTSFVPARTEFGVVRLLGDRAEARRERWERIAREAARQSGRGDAPVIRSPCAWSDALAAAGTASGVRFCLYERADEPLAPGLLRAIAAHPDGARALAFAAGPEGGLSEAEVRVAGDSGWTVVSLGDIVLRTETVATAVLGAVRVLTSHP